METISLQILVQIIGIGSASGIIYKDDSLYIVGDNSGFLYEYTIKNKELKRHPLLENPLENTPKKDKSDFEAITYFGDHFYIFGSGSTANRNKMIQMDSKTNQIITSNDVTDLYAVMQSFGKIKAEDFNLESAIYNGETWYLFNRGNGKSKKNVVFTISAKNLTNEFSILSNDFKLPKINGIRSSFTDAVLVDNKIYFLATAENTDSTYNDGEILGSLIGCIDMETMEILFTKKISDTHKFEGLTLFSENNSTIDFLLCEDNDTEVLETKIYHLTLNK